MFLSPNHCVKNKKMITRVVKNLMFLFNCNSGILKRINNKENMGKRYLGKKKEKLENRKM